MSQDEAALVIQKKFRGYQARKEYGPLIHSEKLNTEVASMMKQYCRKWKAKSVFQVLLMYRAAKHQETVYMSQQVHLYNQNAVSALQTSNKERVSLHNINPDTTPSQFLGRFVPKVWKLPFRLNDMPFCDSSYLCSTMGKRTLNKDDVPWDDPYKRRSRLLSPSGKATDLEGTGLQVSVDEGGDVFSFIQTPYTRDPNYVESVYMGQPYRKGDHFFTEKSGKQRRHSRKKTSAPPAPQIYNNNNKFGQAGPQFNNSNTSSGYGKPSSNSPTSGYQPPHPSKSFVSQQYNDSENSANFNFSKPSSNSPTSGYQPPHPSKSFVSQQYNDSENNANFNFRDNLKPLDGNQKQTAIQELEMKFKQINNSENEEEAPTFNFQAMLRKTNHKRASLRRSPDTEMSSPYGHSSFPVIPEQRSVNQTNNYINNNNNNNVIYNSSSVRNMSGAPRQLMRQDSGDCRKMMSHHYKESLRNAKPDEVTTEIAPGIIIQGHVAEL